MEDEYDKLVTDHWQKIRSAMSKGELENAAFHLYEILRYGASPAASNRLAIIFMKQGKKRKATRYFKRAIKYESTAASNHNLGLCYYERRMYKKALKSFLRATELDPSPARCIAVATTLERMGHHSEIVEWLEVAVSLENNNLTRRIYVQALRTYRKDVSLSSEVLDALEHNKMPWELTDVENYSHLLKQIETSCNALSALVKTLRRKRLTQRSIHTIDFATVFVHNALACKTLLERNYSHAAQSLARSCFEIYIKTKYALLSDTYQGYAQIDRQAILNSIKANERLIALPDTAGEQRERLRIESRKLRESLSALNNQYKDLSRLPSMRQIAITLDGGVLADNYRLYVEFYEKGSASSHSNRRVIDRIVNVSGTPHAGLFVDSHKLCLEMIEIVESYGHSTLSLPEVTKYSRNLYNRRVKKAERVQSIRPSV